MGKNRNQLRATAARLTPTLPELFHSMHKSKVCKIRALKVPFLTLFPWDWVPPGTQLPGKGFFWRSQTLSQGHPSLARAKASARSSAMSLAHHVPPPPHIPAAQAQGSPSGPSPTTPDQHHFYFIPSSGGFLSSPSQLCPAGRCRVDRATMEVTPHTGGCQGRQSIPACSPAPGAAAEGNQTTAHCCLQQGLCCRLMALSVWETPVLCHSSKRCSKKKLTLGSPPRCCQNSSIMLRRRCSPSAPTPPPALPQTEPPHTYTYPTRAPPHHSPPLLRCGN